MKYKSRKFLNQNEELLACMSSNIDITECENDFKCTKCKIKDDCREYKLTNIDAYLTIRDCNNEVSIDFCIDNSSVKDEYIQDRIYKMDTLISEIKAFKANFLKAIKIMKSNVVSQDKRVKDKKGKKKKVKSLNDFS